MENIRQEIEVACDNLKKELLDKICPKQFEVNRWYKSIGFNVHVFYTCSKSSGFREGNWVDSIVITDHKLWELITFPCPKLENLLKQEIDKRGYKEGVKMVSLYDGNIYTLDNGGFKFYDNGVYIINGSYFVFKNGKWAEIIEETKEPKISKEERFLQLMNNLTRKFDFEKEAENIYYLNSKGEMVYNEDYKNEKIYCSYPLFWSIFEKEYGMQYQEIQAFVKDMMEKHFKMKGLTPLEWLGIEPIRMEKHFKM